jgi:hypothetical protein
VADSSTWQDLMARKTSNLSKVSLTPPARTLTERVTARVTEAGLALDARVGKAAPARQRLRAPRLAGQASPLKEGTEAQREARSLRRVYCEMKATYRRYRRQTGSPAVPALREAVRAYKRGKNLALLVNVATFLDDRELLAW